MTSVSGVVVVDKPCGVTSHDVVDRIRRLFGTRRVGHAGTLDPLATGVLVVCIGHATRIVEYLAATRKRYRAEVLFGTRTDTQDVTGNEVGRADTSYLTRECVLAALPRFRGRISQTPPMHSAVHHEGKRLYELARRGIEVERQGREVEIHSLVLIEFTGGPEARAVIDVECSSGTYIRTLAADLGDAVGTGAVMSSLRRTSVGAFEVKDALSLEQLTTMKDQETLDSAVKGIAEALRDWARIVLTEAESEAIRMGKRIFSDPSDAIGRVLLTDDRGHAVALAENREGMIAPFKVLPAQG